MDLLEPAYVDLSDASFQAQYNAEAADAATMIPPHAVPDVQVALAKWNVHRQEEHKSRFPLNDNLWSMVFYCLADLKEDQRERMSSTLQLQGYRVQTYTFEKVREQLIELLCNPKNSLDNPNLSGGGHRGSGRSFCVMEDGDMDESFGYWCEDEDSGEVGFLPEFEDIFWLYDEVAEAWLSRPFKGRTVRRGTPKGRGKGKGRKGFFRFTLRKEKEKENQTRARHT